MNQPEIKEYRKLKRAGWDVDKTPQVHLNSGSETPAHAHAKLAVAMVGIDNGYRCSTETGHEDHGEIDALLYAPDRINWAVELETDPTPEIVADKQRRYVESNTVIDDIQVISVGELPANLLDMHDRVVTELGLY